MKNNLFLRYSKEHVHFYDEELPAILRLGLTMTQASVKKPRIVDLGCGDGRLIFAMYRKGLLSNVSEIYGVDISPERIKRMSREMPFVKGIISDALNVKELPSSSFDLVICSQLIEHVKDDITLVLEIKRLLKEHGLAYISSVVKKWYGIYLYFKNGSFRLDPTHVREYSSLQEFLKLFEERGFEVIKYLTNQITYPLTDLAVRTLIKFRLTKPDVRFYEQHKILARFRKLRIPVLGYNHIGVLVRKIG